jgi:hypothetical protein
MGFILGLLTDGLAGLVVRLVGLSAESLSKDHRDDPVYKKNLQRLIEHHRQFENKE